MKEVSLIQYLPVWEGQKGNNCVIYAFANCYEIMHKQMKKSLDLDDILIAETYSLDRHFDKSHTFTKGTNSLEFFEYMKVRGDEKLLPYEIKESHFLSNPEAGYRAIQLGFPLMVSVSGYYEPIQERTQGKNTVKWTSKKTSKSKNKKEAHHSMCGYGIGRDSKGYYIDCVNTWTNSEYARVHLNDKNVLKGLIYFDIDWKEQQAFPDIDHLDETSKKAWQYCKDKGYLKGDRKGNAVPDRIMSDYEKEVVLIDRMKNLSRNQVVNMIYNLKI